MCLRPPPPTPPPPPPVPSWCPLWDECVLCVRAAGETGGCYGFVFISCMNRGEPGNVMTASRFSPLQKNEAHWICESTAKAKNGLSKRDAVFIVALCPHEELHTKHAMFLQGCPIWALWSNIYSFFFLSLTIISLFCCSTLLLFCAQIWFLFVVHQRCAVRQLSEQMKATYGVNVHKFNAASLLSRPSYCFHPSSPFPLCFIKTDWGICVFKKWPGLLLRHWDGCEMFE